MTYCQDGLQVYFATETQEYTNAQIYGHYELQPNYVNDRPYFKKDSFGLWWDGMSQWWIGEDIEKGQAIGYATVEKDVFCPQELSEFNWRINDGISWWQAYYMLGITCKCIFIQTKQSEFHIKMIIFHGIR